MVPTPRLPSPRPGQWSAPPQPVRWTFRPLPSYLTWVYLPYQISVWASNYLNPALTLGIFRYFVVGTGLALLIFGARAGRDFAASIRTARDRAFSDRPEGLEELSVEIAFSVGGRYLGLDRGVVWFENGLIHFSGKATSFVLAASDFETRVSRSDVPKNVRLLATNRARTLLHFRPLVGWGMFAFPFRLRRFHHAAEAPQGSRQWPTMAAFGEPEPEAPILLDSPEAIGEQAARTGVARGVVRR